MKSLQVLWIQMGLAVVLGFGVSGTGMAQQDMDLGSVMRRTYLKDVALYSQNFYTHFRNCMVDLKTGELRIVLRDFSMSLGGETFNFNRLYTGRPATRTVFGPGWTYDMGAAVEPKKWATPWTFAIEKNRIHKVTFADQTALRMEYDEQGSLTTVTALEDNRCTFHYDKNGCLVRDVRADGFANEYTCYRPR
jgi:YD repeat-containing protein